MYEETLEISINPSYNADEFIDDLKAELEGEIDALIKCEIDEVKDDVVKIEPKIALERIRVIRDIMERLNLI
mgnify:CR=1 FL=1|tara:strand:- start:6497 stop:6712 length:216 start_codon:yes stop_codon:yes gene_type:complete